MAGLRRWEGRLGVAQRVVATLALLVALGALGSTFRSFAAYGTIGCGAPMLGSKVEHPAPSTSFLFGREASVCRGNGHSRLAVAGAVGVLALIVGIAGWLKPLGLPWWATGEDPEWLAQRRREGDYDRLDDPAVEPPVPAGSLTGAAPGVGGGPPAAAPPPSSAAMAETDGVPHAPIRRSPAPGSAERLRQARARVQERAPGGQPRARSPRAAPDHAEPAGVRPRARTAGAATTRAEPAPEPPPTPPRSRATKSRVAKPAPPDEPSPRTARPARPDGPGTGEPPRRAKSRAPAPVRRAPDPPTRRD